MILKKTLSYLSSNITLGLKTSPFTAPLKAWLTFPVYVLLALGIGHYSGLFEPVFLKSKMVFILPVTLFVFPSFLEEAFFRGILIPNDAKNHSKKRIWFYLVMSTVLFILWHPVNALTFNTFAIPLFLNPYFLLLCALLGITCGISYIVSRSLWIPIIIHWLTVVVWVVFLGGRNMILEM